MVHFGTQNVCLGRIQVDMPLLSTKPTVVKEDWGVGGGGGGVDVGSSFTFGDVMPWTMSFFFPKIPVRKKHAVT